MAFRKPSCARPPSARGQRKRLIEEPPEQDIRADGRRYAEPAKKGRPTDVRDFDGFERIDMVIDLYRMKAAGFSTAEAKAEVTTSYTASVAALPRASFDWLTRKEAKPLLPTTGRAIKTGAD